MKKFILFICFAILSWCGVYAQTSGAVVTTVPASFTAEDQVKIIVDVSKVGNLRGKGPLYVWTWHPSDPPITGGNGAWDDSNEAMKMTQEGPDKWSWTVTPTEFYKKEPGELTEIKFLVKANNGSGDAKTDDITVTVAPLIFVPNVFRVFPKVIGPKEAVTIYLDQKLATDENTKRMTPTTAKISLFDDSGNPVDGEKTVTLTAQGNQLFSYTFFPPKLFAIPAGAKVTTMKVTYVGTMKDPSGANMNVDSPVFTYGFDTLTK
ncbi:MAG TPA: hypothetical protein VD794_16110 [Flavisolibacter sp.]|nr:hypothetical protein [Flavisolibacter sp.]